VFQSNTIILELNAKDDLSLDMCQTRGHYVILVIEKNDTEGIHELANKSTSQTTSTTSAATQTSAATTPISAHTTTAAATALIPKNDLKMKYYHRISDNNKSSQ